MLVFSGLMGELTLQAMAVTSSLISFMYDIAFGFSVAVASQVGQYVGLNRQTIAK